MDAAEKEKPFALTGTQSLIPCHPAHSLLTWMKEISSRNKNKDFDGGIVLLTQNLLW
jgi:hypothetical protein